MAADEQHVTRFNLRIKAYILQPPVSTLCIREKQFSDKFVIRGQRKKKKKRKEGLFELHATSEKFALNLINAFNSGSEFEGFINPWI